jgi:hypothetical protein
MIKTLSIFTIAVLVLMTISGCSTTPKSPCITTCESEYSKCISRGPVYNSVLKRTIGTREECERNKRMCINNCKMSESLEKIEKSADPK